MADRIKLSPDELITSAKRYTEGSQQVAEILQNLTTEQNAIRENWEGDGFTSFDDQFTELSPKVQEFSDLLEDINQQLNKVAEIMRQTDSDIASAIRG